MTTKWAVPADLFAGKTVAVLGSGPSMNKALADTFKNLPRIVARRAVQFAPDADVLVSLDGPADPDPEFWESAKDFAGMLIIGHEYEGDDDVMYLNLPHERVTLGEGHVIEVRNNGLAAVRIAAMGGAVKIRLLGFDRGQYEAREDENPGLVGLEQAISALTAELAAQGIEVERVE